MNVFDFILILDILMLVSFTVFIAREATHDVRMGLTVAEAAVGALVDALFAVATIAVVSVVFFIFFVIVEGM